jgi:predicted outer membrane repeat protein
MLKLLIFCWFTLYAALINGKELHPCTCLRLSLYDSFGNGWGKSSYLVMRVLDGPTLVSEENFTLTCFELSYEVCLSVDIGENSELIYSFVVEWNNESAAVEGSEMLWSVQPLVNSTWGSTYYGSYNTSMIFAYYQIDQQFKLNSSVHLILTPAQPITPSSSSTSCIKINTPIMHIPNTTIQSLLSTWWFISNADSGVIVASGSWGTSISPCLPDGVYRIRVTGALDVYSDEFIWSFCDIIDGVAQQEYTFLVNATSLSTCTPLYYAGVRNICEDTRITISPPTLAPSLSPSDTPTTCPSLQPSPTPSLTPIRSPPSETSEWSISLSSSYPISPFLYANETIDTVGDWTSCINTNPPSCSLRSAIDYCAFHFAFDNCTVVLEEEGYYEMVYGTLDLSSYYGTLIISGSNATTNITFVDFSPDPFIYNAGVLIMKYATLVHLTHVSFLSSMGGIAGSVYLESVSQFICTDCIWEESFSRTNGGAFSVLNAGTVALLRNEFYSNYAQNQGGAIYISECFSVTIQSSSFYSNSVSYST